MKPIKQQVCNVLRSPIYLSTSTLRFVKPMTHAHHAWVVFIFVLEHVSFNRFLHNPLYLHSYTRFYGAICERIVWIYLHCTFTSLYMGCYIILNLRQQSQPHNHKVNELIHMNATYIQHA